MPMTDLHPEPMAATLAEADLRAALERARGGDRAALPAVQAALDAHPELWERYGDLAAHARQSWIGLIAGTDLFLAEALSRKVGAMAAELAGPAPTPLESLLVGRVIACFLQIYYADVAFAQAGEVSIRQADLNQKRQARAHKSYLMAIARAVAKSTIGALPAARPGESGPAGAEVVVPDDGDAERVGGPAGPSPLALFDRHDAASKPGDVRADHGGVRGRSAS
jgi:hypothetical protein